MQLHDPVSSLPQIKGKYAELLTKLNVLTVQDLLTHFPRYHKDTSEISKVENIIGEGQYTPRGYIQNLKSVRLRSGRSLQSAVLADETGKITVKWFNQPYLVKAINPETEYLFTGKVKLNGNHWEFYPTNFEAVVPGKELVHLGRVSPQYALTSGISSKWLRNRLKYLVDRVEEIEDLQDELKDVSESKITINTALHNIHFPTDNEVIEPAREYLQLAELVNLQLKLEEQRAHAIRFQAPKINPDPKIIAQFIQGLSFKLTKDQELAIAEILTSLNATTPMNRLLQGDVGSGKTIVALVAALAVVSSGLQVAVLAPTTILARQHFQNFQKMLANFSQIKVELVVSGEESSSADILIGTSAILARKHDLIHDLGLIIVDEQHRFGVEQREELLAPFGFGGEFRPHFLNMTATPIPRTMALALFGDISQSDIFTKPAGRKPIATHLVSESKRASAQDWIMGQVSSTGAQVYWMCPLVEESEVLEAKSAKATYEQLLKIFPKLRIGLLHGKLPQKQKDSVMQEFKDHQLDILVCTSVIEVGIDVPNASVMVIENSERFGLAQLHQIRGRVGRGDTASWCFLFYGSTVETENPEDLSVTAARLQFFASHQNGVEIAEYDLQNRGPGEVYGQRQAGIPNLKIAQLNNIEQIKHSRKLAKILYDHGVKYISLFHKPDEPEHP